MSRILIAGAPALFLYGTIGVNKPCGRFCNHGKGTLQNSVSCVGDAPLFQRISGTPVFYVA